MTRDAYDNGPPSSPSFLDHDSEQRGAIEGEVVERWPDDVPPPTCDVPAGEGKRSPRWDGQGVAPPPSITDDEDHNEEDHGPPSAARRKPGASKTVLLARLIEQRTSMVLSPIGRAYATVDGTALACDSNAFMSWCSATLWNEHQMTIAKSTIADVVRALSHGLPTRPVPVRVGGKLDRITLDLGSSAIAVTAGGIEPSPESVFSRPPGSQPLPSPIMPADPADAPLVMEGLRKVLGIANPIMIACVAWLLAALRPEGPYPILFIRGEQGSGKSTLAKALRAIVDPRRPALGTLPKDPRDLAILAEHVHVVGIDNLSTISGEMSDAMCRLATGDGFTTRALYSDRDLAVFEMARPMIMTSIVDAATRPDLLDRALIVDLPQRTERRNDHEIDGAVVGLVPNVLGALLSGVSMALQGDEATVPDAVRMRAPASFAMKAAPALGVDPEAIVQAYLDSRVAAHGVTAEDPVVEALMGYLKPGQTWTGTMGLLLDNLNDRRHGSRPRGWPESPRGMSATIKRLVPTLRELGVHLIAPEGREGKERATVYKLTRDVD